LARRRSLFWNGLALDSVRAADPLGSAASWERVDGAANFGGVDAGETLENLYRDDQGLDQTGFSS